MRAVAALAAVSVIFVGSGCEKSPGSRTPDGGTATDAHERREGELSLTLLGAPGCRDVGLAHPNEADPLFGFALTGPASQRVEVWASRPACGATPFFFESVDLDATGHGEMRRTNAASANCEDNLIGAWEVFVLDHEMATESIDLVFVNGTCAAGPSCENAPTWCPPSLRDAGI